MLGDIAAATAAEDCGRRMAFLVVSHVILFAFAVSPLFANIVIPLVRSKSAQRHTCLSAYFNFHLIL